jgi:hypothetical protein
VATARLRLLLLHVLLGVLVVLVALVVGHNRNPVCGAVVVLIVATGAQLRWQVRGAVLLPTSCSMCCCCCRACVSECVCACVCVGVDSHVGCGRMRHACVAQRAL